jgi:hypothetical protein
VIKSPPTKPPVGPLVAEFGAGAGSEAASEEVAASQSSKTSDIPALRAAGGEGAREEGDVDGGSTPRYAPASPEGRRESGSERSPVSASALESEVGSVSGSGSGSGARTRADVTGQPARSEGEGEGHGGKGRSARSVRSFSSGSLISV